MGVEWEEEEKEGEEEGRRSEKYSRRRREEAGSVLAVLHKAVGQRHCSQPCSGALGSEAH